MIKVQVVSIVALFHQSLFEKIARENIGVLVDAPILDRALSALNDALVRLETIIQKEYLKWERPSRHVLVEVSEIGILSDRLKMGGPAESIGEHLSQSRFACSDVARYSDEDLVSGQFTIPRVCFPLVLGGVES